MDELYLRDNPHLGEHPLAFNLSARIPSHKKFASIFTLESGEMLDTRDALAGSFPGISLKIIHIIFQQLDLASLAKLGATSKGMQRLVSSLPKLVALMHCAPDAIRAINAAKAGRLLVCSDMYEKLLQPTCDQCGDPGETLHIFRCERLCNYCLTTVEHYRALRPSEAVAQYALNRNDVYAFPSLRVPAYSDEAFDERRFCFRQVNTSGWKLIDPEDVFRLSIKTHGSVDEARRRGSESLRKLLITGGFRNITPEDWLEISLRHAGEPSEVFKGRIIAHLPPGVESACSVSILFPWYDVSTGFYGLPVLCTACLAGYVPLQGCYYCAPGRDEHMARRGEIIDGTHVKNT
ncbi:Cyclin-like F-box [Cordyceps militaris]|uniref:Cyclin-like F-box n=1 Tax=Cordyceps militaris TaxID=73501 RepID=A0A2H4SGP7_CORMI|nr:Cyclin-like F-box [Cordyceps militaris]